MTDLHLLMGMITCGFTISFILMRIMWNSLREDIKSLRTDVQDMDRRLCRLEGAFSSKEGCLLRYDHEKNKKVE